MHHRCATGVRARVSLEETAAQIAPPAERSYRHLAFEQPTQRGRADAMRPIQLQPTTWGRGADSGTLCAGRRHRDGQPDASTIICSRQLIRVGSDCVVVLAGRRRRVGREDWVLATPPRNTLRGTRPAWRSWAAHSRRIALVVGWDRWARGPGCTGWPMKLTVADPAPRPASARRQGPDCHRPQRRPGRAPALRLCPRCRAAQECRGRVVTLARGFVARLLEVRRLRA